MSFESKTHTDAKISADPIHIGLLGRKSTAVKRVTASNDNAYKSARRHSFRVKVLKFMLPVAAALMLGGFFGYTYIVSPGGFTVDASGTSYSDGKLVMANPKLDGFTRDNLPYSMTATRAVQDLVGDDGIALEDISASLPISADNRASISASSGIYDRAGSALDITSDMKITTTDGLVALLKSAKIDIKGGSLATSDPVDIAIRGMHIAANSMGVSESGKVYVFEGRVKMTIQPTRTADLTQDTGSSK